MKRTSAVGETRFKVWRLTDGRVRVDTVEVEFDSPSEEWICDPQQKWGRKSTHNKVNKATGETKYSEGYNSEKVFKSPSDARNYATKLEVENLILAKNKDGNFVERSLSDSIPN